MEPSPNTGAMPRTFELPEALDLPAAGILAKSLLGLTGAGLSIDAGKVQRLGASCLQVLLSAALTWKAEGHSLILAQGSDRFLDDLRLLGFTPETFLTGARAQ